MKKNTRSNAIQTDRRKQSPKLVKSMHGKINFDLSRAHHFQQRTMKKVQSEEESKSKGVLKVIEETSSRESSPEGSPDRHDWHHP